MLFHRRVKKQYQINTKKPDITVSKFCLDTQKNIINNSMHFSENKLSNLFDL